MPDFEINKGVGKGPEFKGLRGRWIMLLLVGLVIIIVLAFAIQLSGLSPYVGVSLVILAGSGLIYYVFEGNRKYGEHGLTKLIALKRRPKYLINRYPRLFRCLLKKEEKKKW